MGKRQSSMESVVVVRISLKQRMKNILKRFIPIPTNAFIREVNHIISEQDRKIDQLANLIKQQNDKVKMQLEKVDVVAEQQKFLIDGLDEVKKELLSQQKESSMILSNLQEVRKEFLLQQKESSMILSNLQEDLKNKSVVSFEELNKLSKGETQRIINSFKGTLSQSARNIFYTTVFERNFYKNSFTLELFDSPTLKNRFLQLIRGLDNESIQFVCQILNRLKLIMATSGDSISLNIYTPQEQEALIDQYESFRKSILKISEDMYCWNGYILPTNYFEYSTFIGKHGIHLIDDMENISCKHIIDVGGFVGDSALLFSPLTDKMVHSFEASPDIYEQMKKTIEFNNLANVIPIQCALTSHENSSIMMNICQSGGSSSIQVNEGISYSHQIEITATTLDKYVAENNLEVGLIKVDIEGAEQDFLKGAMKTIVEQKPVLLLSIYHSADDFFDIKPMLESLNLGYKFKIYHPPIHTIAFETLLIAQIPK